MDGRLVREAWRSTVVSWGAAILISSLLIPHSFWRVVRARVISEPWLPWGIYMVVVLGLIAWLVTRVRDLQYRSGIFLAWGGATVVHAIMSFRKVSELMPWWLACLMVLPWIWFLGWIAWWPLVRRFGYTSYAVSVVLLSLAIPSCLLMTAEGFSGEGKLGIMWRKASRSNPIDHPPVEPVASHRTPTSSPTANVAPAVSPASEPDLPTSPSQRDIPFLGPQRDGVVANVTLTSWDVSPPQEQWRQEIGYGWSGFAVRGELASTMDKRGDNECTILLELETGKERWVSTQPVSLLESAGGDGPRATPAFAGDRVISLGSTGLLRCLTIDGGEEVWFRDILHSNDNLPHGVAGTPLLVGDRIYVCPTRTGGPCLACYDLHTGVLQWESGNRRASYSSPMLVTLLGIPQILVYHQEGLESFDPTDGTSLWQFAWTNNVATNVAQPIVVPGREDQLVLATGYDRGVTLVTVTHDPQQGWQAAGGWQSNRLKPKFSTPVIWQNQIIGLDNAILAGLDLAQGTALWKSGRYGFGQTLLVGNHLLVMTETGDLLMLALSDKQPREVARISALSGKCWGYMTFAPPYLLLRNGAQAVCYRLELQ